MRFLPEGCTLGFVGRRNSDSAAIMITAGHCLTSSGTRTANDESGTSHTIGGRWTSNFGSRDYAAMFLATSYWGQEGIVWVSANHEKPIYSTGTSTMGETICKTGVSTGTTCGNITGLNVAVNYGGTIVSALGRADLCGEPGDSGGPVAKTNVAGCIISGENDPDVDCSTYFQGINGALSGMGHRSLSKHHN